MLVRFTHAQSRASASAPSRAFNRALHALSPPLAAFAPPQRSKCWATPRRSSCWSSRSFFSTRTGRRGASGAPRWPSAGSWRTVCTGTRRRGRRRRGAGRRCGRSSSGRRRRGRGREGEEGRAGAGAGGTGGRRAAGAGQRRGARMPPSTAAGRWEGRTRRWSPSHPRPIRGGWRGRGLGRGAAGEREQLFCRRGDEVHILGGGAHGSSCCCSSSSSSSAAPPLLVLGARFFLVATAARRAARSCCRQPRAGSRNERTRGGGRGGTNERTTNNCPNDDDCCRAADGAGVCARDDVTTTDARVVRTAGAARAAAGCSIDHQRCLVVAPPPPRPPPCPPPRLAGRPSLSSLRHRAAGSGAFRSRRRRSSRCGCRWYCCCRRADRPARGLLALVDHRVPDGQRQLRQAVLQLGDAAVKLRLGGACGAPRRCERACLADRMRKLQQASVSRGAGQSERPPNMPWLPLLAGGC